MQHHDFLSLEDNLWLFLTFGLWILLILYYSYTTGLENLVAALLMQDAGPAALFSWNRPEIVKINKTEIKKYCKAEYVQRVPSSNVHVLFVFEVVLIVVFYRRLSSIKGCLQSKVVFH